MPDISIYCLVEMERYWLAVLVVAFLTLSSANGAALTGPGEEGNACYRYFLWAVDSFHSIVDVCSLHCEFYTPLQEPALIPIFTKEVGYGNFSC